jgi:hypothetical protein
MRVRWAMSCAAMLAGCTGRAATGSTSSTGTTGGGHCPLPTTVTEENFSDAFSTAVICASVGCSPIADGMLAKAKETPYPIWQAATIAAAANAGSLSIDYAKAAPCLAAMADGCRAQSFKPPAECRGVLVPKQPQGNTCYTNLDCTGGYCINESLPGCAGTCSVNDGGCTAPTDCGQFQTCVAGRCVEGAAEAASCTQDSDCQVDLGCVGGVCAAPGAAGAACAADLHCRPGLFCAIAGDAGACTAGHGIGNPCSAKESSLACGYGSYCDSESGQLPTCVAYGAVGDPCSEVDAAFGVPTCQAGLVCTDSGCEIAPSTGPCEKLIGVEACDVSNYCDDTNLCQPFRPDGQACDPNDRQFFGCLSGICNDGGTCVPPGAFCPPSDGA